MYNFYPKKLVQPPGCAPNVLLIMKLTTLFFVAAILQVSASTFAQKITLSEQNTHLNKVFKKISDQTGYDFIVSTENLKRSIPVNISLQNEELKPALDKLFANQPLTFVIQDKIIIVTKKIISQSIKNDSQKDWNISGIITDAARIPLPGATVKIKGKTAVVITNPDGSFIITAESDQIVLIVSYIGYQTVELAINRTSVMPVAIQLIAESSSLNQVQVIGYGTTTKRMNTGSVTTVTAADIGKQPVSNPLAALEGRVPGLVITQTSGVAGSSFKAQIRGQSALDPTLSHNDPLFIIDGVPFESGITASNQINNAANNPTSISIGGLSPLNTINPSDIESIDVLKDADATAIYGSRGANGVILITTKKGKAGSTQYNFTANTGVSKIGRTMNMLNTAQYLELRREAFTQDGLTPNNVAGDPGFAPDLTLWDNKRYTDFKKLLIGGTAHRSDVQGSVSGGSATTQFLISGAYHKETSVFSGDFSDNIASLHFNINHNSADKRFNITLSGSYGNDNNRLPRYDMTRYINLPPNLRLYDDGGKLAWQDNGVVYNTLGTDIINPLSLQEEKYKSLNESLNSNLKLSYRILPGLTIRSSFGYTSFRSDEQSAAPFTSLDPNTASLPSLSLANASNKSWIIEPQLEYLRTTANDRLDVLIGNTYQDRSGRQSSVYGSNYNSDLLLNSIAAAPTIKAFNDDVKYRYTAFFGRINYAYHEKYILNLTGRRDGSSRFAPENRFANFGAVGAAWLFGSERFAKDLLPFLSFGKLRGSYGVTGNDQIGDYKFLNLWTNTSNTYSGLAGLYPRSLYNPDYQWEINKKLEFGLELGFLNDDVLLNVSYFKNRSDNQLINYTLPNQTGFSSVTRNFPGLVENTGLELSLTTRNIHKANFNWVTSFNITFPKNKLLAFPGLESSSYASQYVIGQSLNLINALKYTGVDPQTGLYTVADLNKDGQFDLADYQVQGNTDPKFYGGMQNSLTMGPIDLSFFLEFKKQTGLSYLAQLAGSNVPGWIYNQPDVVLQRWQKPGDITDIQKFTSGFTDTYTAIAYKSLSGALYTDASYIRLKNVSLAYHLPKRLLNRLHIRDIRVYAEAQNLLIITNYKGGDPETQNFYVLPPLRTIIGGLQFTF